MVVETKSFYRFASFFLLNGHKKAEFFFEQRRFDATTNSFHRLFFLLINAICVNNLVFF
jgi:hypothetical protein